MKGLDWKGLDCHGLDWKILEKMGLDEIGKVLKKYKKRDSVTPLLCDEEVTSREAITSEKGYKERSVFLLYTPKSSQKIS